MKKIILLFTVTFFYLSTNAQEDVKWLSFEEAIALNKKTPKPILIDVFTDWCGYCKKMDLYTYANKTIATYINENFYAIKLDGEEKKQLIISTDGVVIPKKWEITRLTNDELWLKKEQALGTFETRKLEGQD